MKRNVSDMDSDCDDVFGDDSKGTPTQSNDSCQMHNRKRRRGIIEKRRRDRINSSLSELRRLVPAAFEKQGSAKLEKAEILQLTVDHLKMLHAKGFDALTFDPHKFAMDYHSIGFRECASEVARYLVAIEGLDLQDPLRVRLMSHLQCYSAQRELSLKGPAPWTPTAPPTNFGPAPSASFGPTTPQYPSNAQSQDHLQSNAAYNCSERLIQDNSSPFGQYNTRTNPPVRLIGHHQQENPAPIAAPPHSGMGLMQQSPPTSSSLVSQGSNQYHGFATSGGYGSTGAFNQHAGSTGRPYRPWGAELAY
ncbi:hypothetical protein JTE90_024146 [Oedothorax gibbosus]|uniref:Hairy/enhancer-of-split related with YRPW motif protein n=1 Tax=Oedothorax gibbosus TaxID=931172 RepID=A0AAV6U5I8_9ARAC|nr:hypothetical protein JTE90_024146 [Oedothorax gibbosus]